MAIYKRAWQLNTYILRYFDQMTQVCGHVDVGMCPHQVLAATLTLFQPGGPHQVLKATGAPD